MNKITLAIEFTQYDGTEETLPVVNTASYMVIPYKNGVIEDGRFRMTTNEHGELCWAWKEREFFQNQDPWGEIRHTHICWYEYLPIRIGDMWARWPVIDKDKPCGE